MANDSSEGLRQQEGVFWAINIFGLDETCTDEIATSKRTNHKINSWYCVQCQLTQSMFSSDRDNSSRKILIHHNDQCLYRPNARIRTIAHVYKIAASFDYVKIFNNYIE